MKRGIAVVLAILAGCDVHAGEPWAPTDWWLAGAAGAGLAIDWGQTRYIARHPERWREKNSALDEHPSVGRVDKYFALASAGTAVLAVTLPRTARRWFLGGVAAVQFVTVAGNHELGIRLDF